MAGVAAGDEHGQRQAAARRVAGHDERPRSFVATRRFRDRRGTRPWRRRTRRETCAPVRGGTRPRPRPDPSRPPSGRRTPGGWRGTRWCSPHRGGRRHSPPTSEAPGATTRPVSRPVLRPRRTRPARSGPGARGRRVHVGRRPRRLGPSPRIDVAAGAQPQVATGGRSPDHGSVTETGSVPRR